jgi:hypothetical protein
MPPEKKNMLRKMYLVSSDYLNRSERPSPKTPIKIRKSKKTTHVTKKIHLYYKWVATRAALDKAAVGHKSLIKAIADFVKAVLLHTPKGPHSPNSESPAHTRADDDDDDVTEVLSDGDVRTIDRNSFSAAANPYLAPFVHKRGMMNVDYGLRKVGDKFYIGNSIVTIDSGSDLYIKDKRFKGTGGLWELLTRKTVDNRLITKEALMQYKNILELTSAHLEGYDPAGATRISRRNKYRNVIAKLFPHTRVSRQQWLNYK